MKIRKHLKKLSILALLVFLNQIAFPTYVLALTGGPTQPEVHGFEPVGTNQMVDLFSGDFTYNIPLFDIGGYPVNMAYHSGVGMEQEASWVGLGWSLTPGAISRNLKGLPDDFKEDEIKFMRKMKPNQTVGLDLKLDPEAFGFELSKKAEAIFGDKQSLSLGVGVTYNNYTGVDINKSVSVSFSNGMINPSIGYSDNGGLSLSAKPSLAAVAKARKNSSESGTNFLGKMASFVALDGEISWNSTSGLGMSVSRDFNLGKLSKYVRSSSLGANIQLNDKVYSPGSDVSMWNYGFRANVALGTEIFGGDAQGQVDFFYNAQRLGPFGDKKASGNSVEWNLKAYGAEYGYVAEQAGDDFRSSLLDFNREHEYPLRDESPLLPVTQLTYDVFSISGQGTGGSFRSYRNDYPMVGKNRTADVPNTQVNIGLDISSVNLIKVGGNASLVFANSSNGYWNSGAAANIGFSDRDNGKLLFEPKYFKKGGEFGAFDQDYLDEIGGEQAARFKLTGKSAVSNTLEYEDGTTVSHGTQSALYNSDVKKDARAPRASAILALTKEEAHNYGFPFSKDLNTGVTSIKSYSGSNDATEVDDGPGYAVSNDLHRMVDMPGKSHHYGEFQITQDNGYTYVYGIPVYNHQTVEASFAVTKPGTNPNNATDQGYVSYDPSDPTSGNTKGRDNFVSRKEIPEYPHSFLLTQILSPDYVDVLGDGVTDDDIGEAVIFNYEKVHDEYGWRNPTHDQPNMGRYMEGLQTDDMDDKASFVYGTKEIWVLHSIESRNMVAQFFTSPRDDSYGVQDESGALDMSKSQRKLDRIELYNKIDRARASASSGYKAAPVKVVHFTYNYTLCDGVPNNGNDEGKLTLTELAFSYGNSGTGLLNPYKFHYEGSNPDYNPLATDRWGNYMAFDNSHPNNQFPYVDQDRVNTDQYAGAWLLDRIELPSGGEINVEYESDDYAYVMERNALSMVSIAGVGKTEDFTTGNKLYETFGAESNFLYFELPSSGTYNNDDDVRNDFKPEGALYFKALFHVKDKVPSTSNDKEYVSGYVKIKDVGMCPWTSGQKYGYVEIEEKRDRNTKYQAMSHAAWKFMLGNLSERINGMKKPSGDLVSAGKDYILSNLSKITQLLKGQMGKMKTERYGQYIDLSKSIMRLKEPTGFKLGGGSRVKQISMDDGWDNMTGSAEGSNDYGSTYTYTTEENGRTISSGVASYEPMVGSDENPYKQPIYYRYKPKSIMGLVKVGREIEEYVVGPYGEMFFPGGGVGYSKVTVKSLATARMEASQITGTPTGYTVNEFYTAKDFPVIQDKTVPDGQSNALGNALTKKFTGNDKNELAMTQGYSFVLNNMHGKPKKNASYGQQGNKVSSTQYVYKTDPTDSRRLDNHVDIINQDGTIESNQLIGVEVDFVADAHESLNSSYQTRIQPGADGFSLGIPPFIAIPNLWFEFSSSSNNLRYISNTKVIYKYGILDEVVQTDETSEVRTKNLLWDAESGQALITRVKNEYEAPLENFNMPAHFAYSGLDGSYKNLDIRLSDKIVNQGVLTVDFGEASDYFEPGDEVILGDLQTTGSTSYMEYEKAWVLDIVDNTSPTNDEIFLIDREGNSITGNSITQFEELRIIRSGKRNQAGATILSVTSTQDLADQISTQHEISNPLQISSAEFSDEWGTYCDRLIEEECVLTDDLRLVLNCLWAKGSSFNQYDEDIGVNLDTECEINYQTNIREQARNMSDITVNVKTSTSKTYYTYTLNLNSYNPDVLAVQNELLDKDDIDFTIELTYDLPSNPGVVASAEFQIGSFTDYGSGSPSWLETMLDQHIGSGNYTVSTVVTYPFLDEKKVVVEKHQAPWFKFLYQQNTNEILIGVGGVDVWDDINRTWDRDGSVPLEVACTLKLQAQPYPGTTVSYGDIASFTSMYENAGKYYLTASLVGGGTMDFELINNCLDLTWCKFQYACGPLQQNKVINPFVTGVRGNWRPVNNYVYHTSRSTTLTPGSLTSASHTDVRQDGVMENFSLDVFTNGVPFEITGDRWISPATITEYTPDGNEIENMDALGRYSSEVFGYDRRVVIAAANNAPHHNIAFDGFEEYTYPYHGDCRKEMHWAMTQYVGLQQCAIGPLPLSSMYNEVDPSLCGSQDAEISADEAHSGEYSLKIDQGASTVTFYSEDLVKSTCTPVTQTSLSPFILGDCDCIGAFEPDADQRYYFSAWVKEEQTDQPSTYVNTKINIKVYDDQSSLIYTEVLEPSGPITEGWQRISGEFTIPSGSDLTLRTEIEVGDPTAGTTIDAVYIDDIRIQPFNSQMKTYVYRHTDLKLSAELDANNYATYYEYDAEGRLLRIKKETEKGIMTIQESRYGVSQ